MRSWRRAATSLTLLTTLTHALPATPSDLPPAQELVRLMMANSLELPNFHRAFKKSIEDNRALPPEEKKRIIALVMERTSRESLEKAMAPAFHKYFTPGDIETLLAFYRSPAGKKLIVVETQLRQEMRRIGSEHAQSILEEVTGAIAAAKASKKPAKPTTK